MLWAMKFGDAEAAKMGMVDLVTNKAVADVLRCLSPKQLTERPQTADGSVMRCVDESETCLVGQAGGGGGPNQRSVRYSRRPRRTSRQSPGATAGDTPNAWLAN